MKVKYIAKSEVHCCRAGLKSCRAGLRRPHVFFDIRFGFALLPTPGWASVPRFACCLRFADSEVAVPSHVSQVSLFARCNLLEGLPRLHLFFCVGIPDGTLLALHNLPSTFL